MYTVYLDNNLCYYPGDEELVTLDMKLELELNTAGAFEFCLPEENPFYGNVINRKTMVKVIKDDKEIFYGEVRECEKDFDNIKRVYAVGVLSFLYDSIQRPAEYHNLSPRQMLETWLNIHNGQVEEKKRIYIGIVTVHDSNDSLYRYTNYETTLDAIREKLVDRIGGYLKIREVSGKRYLDWLRLEDYGKICSQPVKFGVNLLDYAESTTASELYTSVIPLGAKLEESPIKALEAYTNISSVNGGKDYLDIPDAIKEYGRNTAVVHWDDVGMPSNLKKKGEEWLKNNQYENVMLELSAIDLSILRADFDSFDLGDSVHAIAEPYGMDRYFPVQQLTIYLQEPEKNQLVLGSTGKKLLSQQTIDANKKVNIELDKTHETSKFLQDAINNATQMMTGSKGGYKITEFDADGRWLRDLYMDAPNKEDAQYVMQINSNGIGFSRTGFDGPYLNAWLRDGTFLGEWIKAHSIQAESLSTEYITSVEKQIEDAETGAKEWAESKITTSIKALEEEIELSVKEEIKRASGAEEELSSQLKLTSKSIIAEVARAKEREEELSASIALNAENIQLKVARGDFESLITQYYNEVLVAFNNSSKYVQITAGAISIYDSAITNSKKRSMFNQEGNHFYRDGYYLGKIGTNRYAQDESKKGLVFDIEEDCAFMSWSAKGNGVTSYYRTVLFYANKSYGGYAAGMLHAGCDLDMHGYMLRNFKVEGGGINGTIRFKQILSVRSDGTIETWANASLTFKNGFLVEGAWAS